MQDRPTAAELLRDIADLLEGEVLAATSGPTQHHVRVAANLARIVQRELEMGRETNFRERALIGDLLGADGSVAELNAELAARLRANDDAEFARAAWPVLLAVTLDKLAVNKPGHDAYDFAGEQLEA
ncbi:MAG TPA: DUF6285 domain-containing protein [Acidimicrobiales bacterium]|nr:DUF6285 domain-containing protein [Acidimicrobiales bacterium]